MIKPARNEVFGFAGGKGGVGKTTVAVNLAISLRMRGHRVVLFDAGLGLVNSQMALGCECPFNLNHFMSGQKTLQEITVTTPQGVTLVPGASGPHALAALTGVQAARIVQAFSALEGEIDYLIVDMAANLSPFVLALMVACQRRFIVVRDTPSSIADAYHTIKRLIQDYDLNEIFVIPNAVKSQAEGQALFRRVNQMCAQFLNFTTHYLGSIEHDEAFEAAHIQGASANAFASGSASAQSFESLAESVTQIKPISRFSGGMQFFVERLVHQ